METSQSNSARYVGLLCRLALGMNGNALLAGDSWAGDHEPITELISEFKEWDWKEVYFLARQHHVVLRAMPHLLSLSFAEGHEWINSAIEAEQARIDNALSLVAPICESLESAGSIVVIKTLDHWPDFGGDLDLYTDAEAKDVIEIMRDRFHARVAKQSWGDRLANKWNFEVPGLPELVEAHVRRLGQTGEQSLIGKSIIARAMPAQFGAYSLPVPSPEDQIIVSTLQRMFRHFYLRLCDVLNVSQTAEQGAVDYDYLRYLGRRSGIWEGVATYLKIVSEFVSGYRGREIVLPPFVLESARFGSEKVSFERQYFRIPIVPQSARLYAAELKALVCLGEIRNTLRLGLLPLLATAAAVEYKITGSDKGIW